MSNNHHFEAYKKKDLNRGINYTGVVFKERMQVMGLDFLLISAKIEGEEL